MQAVITQALAERLRKDGVRAEVWDKKLLNFFLQVRSGGAASYYIRYKSPLSGLKVPFKIGGADALTANDARGLAQAALAKVAAGQDPAEEKRALHACPTLADFVNSHYLPHAKRTKKSWSTDEANLRCHVLPVLGHKRLSAITTADIDALTLAMRSGDGPSARPYAPASCNRIVVLLRYLFNLALDAWQIPGLKTNPARKAYQFELCNERQVFLSPEQVGELLRAGSAKRRKNNPTTLQVVMLIVLTGVRRANALKARWCEFDEQRALWNIPITKSGKPQVIQLSHELLGLLRSLPSRGNSEYLFPNPATGKPFVSVFHSWNAIRKAAGLPDLRMHDLRHTFASLLINGGASLFMVQKALGHANPKITMRYAHLADATQRQAFQGAADLIAHVLPEPSARSVGPQAI